MNQYCYDIITQGDNDIDAVKVKTHVEKLYKKKKFKELAFTKDDELPFLVLYSAKDAQVCIKMKSKAKKNVDRIEAIHSKLKSADLKIDADISLAAPELFQIEQCAWWDEDCKLAQDQKWSSLVHNGPYFVHILEPYEPHDAPIIYDGQEYDLNPVEERVASFYARRIISEQAGNVIQLLTKDKVFNKNFWEDFKTFLTPAHKKVFKVFSKLDFSPIIERLEELKEIDKQSSAKDKNFKKIKAAEKKQNYGYAIINNIKEPLGNFTIEPAAIFYGRGDNPNRGKIKRDIEPEEVIINIGKGNKIPPPDGHKWKQVIHDQKLAWVASWKDPISNENKYVYFSAEGQLKGKSDLFKYEKARKLNKYLSTVRDQYTEDVTSKIAKRRQLGTVLYLIDHHGIRIGNEKDESETDTVGASTLRVEHIVLKSPHIVFDFLGKDSIRYYKELPVDEDIYQNFEEFIDGKNPGDQLFDLISATDINTYLKTFDKDFSAKVFRTRLASTIMDESLKSNKVKKNSSQDDKKKIFTKANIEVAKILNHQRTVSEKSKQSIKKYQAELKELRAELKEITASGKSTKAIDARIKKKKDLIANKKDTLNVAISTSLTNYIDPRIVVSWSKTNDMSIPKAYTTTLQRKFKWAIDMTEDDWDYIDTPLITEMATLQPSDTAPKTPTPAVKGPKKAVPKKASAKVVPKKASTKVVPKKASTKVVPKKAQEKVIPLATPANDIQLVDYSTKSIAVIGNTKPVKNMLQSLNGKFNAGLTVSGQKVPGWIFSKKNLANVENALKIKLGATTDTVYKQSVIDTLLGVTIIDYSPESIVVIGNTKALQEYLKAIDGSFDKGLTIDNVKTPGWIFPKTQLETLLEILSTVSDDSETDDSGEDDGVEESTIKKLTSKKITSKKTWSDIMNDHELSPKARNIIKCFGRDPNVVQFIKDELTVNVDKKIYTQEFLSRFLACITSYDKSDKEQALAIKKYSDMKYDLLATELVSKFKQSSVPTFLFLIFILYKVSSRQRETYLQRLIRHLTNTKDIQECLCDNSSDETLVSLEAIKDIPLDELYLLPSGRCIQLDDLISHLKKSSNKIQDPTVPFGTEKGVVWSNGWDLRIMLDRIQQYNYTEGLLIKQEFKKVLADVATVIPQNTKDMVSELYYLFYFPEEPNNQTIINSLVKYGYPTAEPPGKLADAQAVVAKGTGDQLDEFRTMLGFKLNHHIMEELSHEEREAFLFAGEFAGMGKEAWGKLSMGEFCTKTFGAILHNMSNLFSGKYALN